MTTNPTNRLLMLATVCMLGAIALGSPATVHAQIPSGGYQITRLGFTGAGYEYTSGGKLHHASTVVGVNAAGQAGGETERATSSGGWLGNDAWVQTGITPQLVGLTGGIYQATTANGVFRRNNLNQINGAGQAAGEAFRLKDPSDQFGALGRDAWFYNGSSSQQVGLTGGDFEYGATGGQFRFSSPTFVDAAGRVAGFSNRYATDGTQIGIEAWVFNGASTQNITLTGPGYESNDGVNLRRTSLIQAFENGYAAGRSGRVTTAGVGLGSEAWLYNGVTTRVIGLAGPGYDVTSPDGVARQNQAILVNSSGKAAGYASRYGASASDSLGYDAWFFNGATTQVIGLTGLGYEWNMPVGNLRATLPVGLNDSGMAIGQSVRITAAGDQLGSDSWIFDGTTTRRIGLGGAGYDYTTPAGLVRTSGIQSSLAINNAGQVAGIATRYDASGGEYGQAGWFYDIATDVSTPLVFSVQAGTNYSFTEPSLVTEDGVVLGTYEKYNGATSQGRRPFWWNLADGFHDLSELVAGGLTAAGWASLKTIDGQADNLAGAGPQYIVGSGLVTGEVTNSSTDQSIYLLTAVRASSNLLADFNNDTKVDQDDLALWSGGFGATGIATHGQGDADGDHDVDGADFLIWQHELGAGGSGIASQAAAPEPASAILFALAMAATTRRRR